MWPNYCHHFCHHHHHCWHWQNYVQVKEQEQLCPWLPQSMLTLSPTSSPILESSQTWGVQTTPSTQRQVTGVSLSSVLTSDFSTLGAKQHPLSGSFWGEPRFLGSPAWICFWPLWPQHGILSALPRSNSQATKISLLIQIHANLDHYMEFRRLPMLDSVGHKTVICGPESFTPDSMPLFGETPEVSNMPLFGETPEVSRQVLSSMPWKDVWMQVAKLY